MNFKFIVTFQRARELMRSMKMRSDCHLLGFSSFSLPAKPVLVLDGDPARSPARPPARPWKGLAAHFSPAGGVRWERSFRPGGRGPLGAHLRYIKPEGGKSSALYQNPATIRFLLKSICLRSNLSLSPLYQPGMWKAQCSLSESKVDRPFGNSICLPLNSMVARGGI